MRNQALGQSKPKPAKYTLSTYKPFRLHKCSQSAVPSKNWTNSLDREIHSTIAAILDSSGGPGALHSSHSSSAIRPLLRNASIISRRGYFYLKPRTLQVLFCQCVLNDPEKLGYFLKRKAPNRTPRKPEFRASCSWVFIIWPRHFRTCLNSNLVQNRLWSRADIWTQRRGLNEIVSRWRINFTV